MSEAWLGLLNYTIVPSLTVVPITCYSLDTCSSSAPWPLEYQQNLRDSLPPTSFFDACSFPTGPLQKHGHLARAFFFTLKKAVWSWAGYLVSVDLCFPNWWVWGLVWVISPCFLVGKACHASQTDANTCDQILHNHHMILRLFFFLKMLHLGFHGLRFTYKPRSSRHKWVIFK